MVGVTWINCILKVSIFRVKMDEVLFSFPIKT